MRRALAAFAAVALTAASARADVISVTVAPNLPVATGSVVGLGLSGLPQGSSGSYALAGGTTLDVAVASGQGIVSGNAGGLYADPVGGTVANPVAWSGNFLSTGINSNGAANGSLSFAFSGSQKYFGLLWGTVDAYNTLDLLLNGSVVGSITGSEVDAAAAAAGNPTGPGGDYVQLNDTSGAFDEVALLSTSPSFEAADFQVSTQTQPVPEPAALALLGSGLACLLLLRRRRA